MFEFVLFFLAISAVFMLAMAHAAYREQVPRGVALSLAGVFLSAGITALLVLYQGHPIVTQTVPVLFWLTLVFIVASLIPWFPVLKKADTANIEQFDERNHMFARGNLKFHPELGNRYHRSHPEKKAVDEEIWRLPELGEPGSKFYDRYVSSISDSAFDLLDRSYVPLSNRPPVAVPAEPVDPGKLMEAVRITAFQYGAVDVGITSLKPYHLYSIAGRQAGNWGEKVENHHRTAIVFVVPMSNAYIRHAPSLPAILESAHCYVETAKIAHIVAEILHRQGLSATAHVDGHYQLICAPLAEAAGMGHVGRMGIFMHEVYGPSVRLSVVTVDFDLPETKGNHEYMEHFCNICKKCADNCPSRAIPHGEKPVSRGFAHWSVDQESCYRFWRKIGTDCAVCIRSCPFSKPDTLMHRIVRGYIRRNPLNQRLALLGDDLFYGRKLKLPTRNVKWKKLPAVVRRAAPPHPGC
ncbi:MAG: 4Fe-4S dicluster domain-containing protein [Acidobacteria bacterium]|nr:4Fe-4S dicluster domain-containing protein [Acidobacteriota bacterium]